jgi:Tfp pilus assembly protein PilV
MRKRITLNRALAVLMVLVIVGSLGVAQYRAANAGPAQPQEQWAIAAIDDNGHVDHRVLLSAESRTMADTTPVNGSTVCIEGDADQFAAQLTLSGTMAGTAPTLDVVLQHSIDGGTNWITVNDFTDINATVTPASQYVSWSDVPASTAVTFGDCYRARYTFGGTGTVTANVGVALIAK